MKTIPLRNFFHTTWVGFAKAQVCCGIAVIALLSACGGGGGSSGSTETPVVVASSVALSATSLSSSSSSSSSSASSVALTDGSFTNPLFYNGADPWLQFYQGNYYLTTTTWTSQIVMRKSPTLAGLAKATPIYIWSDATADRCCNFWAFEFHRLQGPNGYRWYLMYSAGTSVNLDGQKLRVLESAGDDPMGPYSFKGTLMPNTWNIDGTYFQYNNQLYVLWSEWVGALQSLWIAKMDNPWTISGNKTIISQPTLAWETIGGNTNEGPEVLQHEGRTFVTFSASSCNTPDYKLGLLELTGTDPLQASSWTKNPNPVFQKTTSVFGPGHNGFFMSPDATENWIVYHGNDKASQGCGDTRAVRMQKFSWDANGAPNFGEPAAPTEVIAPPSGESGPIAVIPEGAAMQLVNRNSNLCLTIANDATTAGSALVQRACTAASSQWVLDYTADGAYRLANKNAQLFASVNADQTAIADAWLNKNSQRWSIETTTDGWFKIKNFNTQQYIDIANCATVDLSAAQTSTTSVCQEWRLQPVDKLAVLSANSGKAISVADCSIASGANIYQWEWQNTECQKWTFTHTDSGYFNIAPAHNSSLCLGVEGASMAVKGNIAQIACSGNNAQWRIELLADGTMKLVARYSSLVVDIAACGLANGINIDQYTWLDNMCQRFVLRNVN